MLELLMPYFKIQTAFIAKIAPADLAPVVDWRGSALNFSNMKPQADKVDGDATVAYHNHTQSKYHG